MKDPFTDASSLDDWRAEAALSDRVARWLAKARIRVGGLLRQERYLSAQLNDVVNDVFVKWKGQADFKNTEHFVGRMVLDARSVLIDRRRAKLRLKRGGWPHVESFDEARHGAGLIVDTRRVEMRDHWDRAMASLKPEEVAVVDLRLDGHRFGEIARRLGFSESKVRRIHVRATLLLKSALVEEARER